MIPGSHPDADILKCRWGLTAVGLKLHKYLKLYTFTHTAKYNFQLTFNALQRLWVNFFHFTVKSSWKWIRNDLFSLCESIISSLMMEIVNDSKKIILCTMCHVIWIFLHLPSKILMGKVLSSSLDPLHAHLCNIFAFSPYTHQLSGCYYLYWNLKYSESKELTDKSNLPLLPSATMLWIALSILCKDHNLFFFCLLSKILFFALYVKVNHLNFYHKAMLQGISEKLIADKDLTYQKGQPKGCQQLLHALFHY